MALNIDRSNDDPFYRYKMPRLLAKVEGKGNGIKTVIVNMHEVAKALSRPPTYPTKYFGCELGAQTQFDIKNDRYIVNGSHTADKLQGLLDGFIKKFVLCPGCSNPETNLQVLVKKGAINQRCIACGYNGSVDMRHKLTTYILKNPPDQDPNAQTPSKGKKHEEKKRKGKKDDEDDKKDRSSPEAHNNHASTAQEQMAAMRESGTAMDVPKSKGKTQEADDDDDWGDDFTEEAVKERMNELSDAAKGLAMTDDLEKSSEDRLNMLYEMIKIKRDDTGLTRPADTKEIFVEAERLEVKDKVPLILVELLLNEKAPAQLPKYKGLFLRFCYQNTKAQKALLGGLEILIAKEYPKVLLPRTSHILKFLYDEDIVEESVLLEWDRKPSKKYIGKEETVLIHKEAQMCIQWLQEAEEESEEEEDDGDNEVIYSTTQKVGEVKTPEPSKSATPTTPTTQTAAVNGNGKTPVVEDDEDDIDIDDI